MSTSSAPTPTVPLRIPWYRSYQLRTLVLLFLLLAPIIVGLHVFTYFTSYTGLVQGMVRRAEVLVETALYSLDNILDVQTNQIRLVTVEAQFRQDLAELPRAYEASPVDFERLRIRVLSSLVATLGTAREAPFWIQELAILDGEGLVWLSTQPEQEGQRISRALLLNLQAARDQHALYLLWGEEPALGYDWAWVALVYPVVDIQGNSWWIVGQVTPDSLVAWLQTLLPLEGQPVLRTANGQAFGYTLDGEQVSLDVAELALEPPLPEAESWNAFVLSMWRGQPIRFLLEPERQVEFMPQAPEFRLVYRPEQGGWLWLLFPYEELGPNVVLGVAFPLQESLFPLTGAISRFLQVQAVIFALVVFGIGWWLSRQVTRPVLEMAQQVQVFAEGRWDVRLPVRGQDEVALLGQVLNQMAASLERLYRSLEEEVQRRTEQVRLLLEWLTHEPPRDAASFQDLLTDVVKQVQETLPQGLYPVLVLWHPERYEIIWRVTTEGAELSIAPAQERTWVQTALQQQQPLLYTRETHREQFPPSFSAVWVQPFPAYSLVAGALVVYSQQESGFDDLVLQQIAELAPPVAGALAFGHLLWRRHALQGVLMALQRLLETLATAADPKAVFNVVVEYLHQQQATALFLVRVPESEDLWQPLYPQELADQTRAITFLLPRGRSWWMEPDISRERAAQRLPREVRQWLQHLKVRGVVVLPVWVEEQIEAILLLGFQQSGEWPDDWLDGLAVMLSLLSQALERADVQQQVRLWHLAVAFLAQSAEAPTLGQALLRLVRTLRREWSHEGDIFFVFVDAEGNFQHTFVFLEDQEQYHLVLSPLEQDLIRRVLRSGQPLVLHQAQEIRQLLEKPIDEREQVVPQSWVGLPIRLGERWLGVWGWRDVLRPHRFDRVEVHRLLTLTERLTPVFHYLLRLQQYEQRLQREEWVHALSTHLVALWDPTTLTEETANELMRIFQATRVEFRLDVDRLVASDGGEPTRILTPTSDEDGGP